MSERIDPVAWIPVGVAAVVVPVLWFAIGAAEASDLPMPMPAWAELLYYGLGREGVVGVFAAAGLFWLWLIAATRFPTLTTTVTLAAVVLGLWAVAITVGGPFGYAAAWAATFLGSLMLPFARARRIASAAVWFGGAALGIGLAVTSGAWCAAVGAAAVGAVGLWVRGGGSADAVR